MTHVMGGCVLLTSPVMATSTGTDKPVNSDTRAQAMAIPALGPSYMDSR